MSVSAIEVDQCYTSEKNVKAVIVASDGVVNKLLDFDLRDQYFLRLANGETPSLPLGIDDLTVVIWQPNK